MAHFDRCLPVDRQKWSESRPSPHVANDPFQAFAASQQSAIATPATKLAGRHQAAEGDPGERMRYSTMLLALILVAVSGLHMAQASEGGTPTKITINTVIGPPDQLGDQLRREIATALHRRHIAAAGEDEPVDFSLDLYVLAVAWKGHTTV